MFAFLHLPRTLETAHYLHLVAEDAITTLKEFIFFDTKLSEKFLYYRIHRFGIKSTQHLHELQAYVM